MPTTTRTEFVGAHVPGDVKRALRLEAAKRGLSVSTLVDRLIRAALRRAGHALQESTPA